MLGIGTGTLFSLALTLFARQSPDARTAGALSGMARPVGYLLAAAAPSGLGYVHGVTGSWAAPLVGLLAVTGGVLGFGVAAARDRQPR